MMRAPAMKNLKSEASEPHSARAPRPLSIIAGVFAGVLLLLAIAVPAFADPAHLVLTQALIEESPRAIVPHPLDALLALPDDMVVWKRESTDVALATAVSLGNDPGLEPLNPFRKRSTDIFRTQRWVTVGQRDMLVRLRVRANARKAMSIEVKF